MAFKSKNDKKSRIFLFFSSAENIKDELLEDIAIQDTVNIDSSDGTSKSGEYSNQFAE